MVVCCTIGGFEGLGLSLVAPLKLVVEGVWRLVVLTEALHAWLLMKREVVVTVRLKLLEERKANEFFFFEASANK